MEELGFSGKITQIINTQELEGFELGRVVVEHKERYSVQTNQGVFSAEITGNLRYSASSRADFPAVGDWVKLTLMDSESAVILEVLPRTTKLERRAVGRSGEVQIIAVNIDFAFIVQSVGHDFNLKRIERYLSICNSAGIEPIILLTKIDLIEANEINSLLSAIRERIREVPVLELSSKTTEGYHTLKKILKKSATYCFLGSSGVGKSTIINHLKGQEVQKTSEVSISTSKGKHTTSHRELFVLPNKSIVIDTPGMREIGMIDDRTGIELTYQGIESLSKLCKFNNCSHLDEVGCAVLEALEAGKLSSDVYDNYQKLQREQAHFARTVAEKRKKGKAQGKLYKAIQAARRKNKY
ncbi:MAG: putative ribosome biogenesis GTPase RsgA [Cyclobacteriaceae bacterium]|nr:MAG: putative ribosome biogenesis GTPase RsgA [Cyclobacteriaceae bacterium]